MSDRKSIPISNNTKFKASFKKNVLTSFFCKWIFDTSFWVSAGISSLVIYTSNWLELPLDRRILVLAFTSSLIVYTADRIHDSHNSKDSNKSSLKSYYTGAPALIVLLTASAVTIFLLIISPFSGTLIKPHYLAG